MTYDEKLVIANRYLAKLTEGMVDWEDLPDINSLHDGDDIFEIEMLCDERLGHSDFPIDDDKPETGYE